MPEFKEPTSTEEGPDNGGETLAAEALPGDSEDGREDQESLLAKISEAIGAAVEAIPTGEKTAEAAELVKGMLGKLKGAAVKLVAAAMAAEISIGTASAGLDVATSFNVNATGIRDAAVQFLQATNATDGLTSVVGLLPDAVRVGTSFSLGVG